jgi:hypothetical protein
MKTLEISKKSSIEEIIDSVQNDFIQENRKYTLLDFQNDLTRKEREKIATSIKKYFDIFIILKAEIPENPKKIEEYLSYGVHGVYFPENLNGNAESQIEKMAYATQIFPEGLIFAHADNNIELIEKMLLNRIIPVVSSCNQDLIDFIKNHKDYIPVFSKYLKYIPVLEENVCNFSLVENIKLKMKLESLNLRKNLMVKKVADSFNSSGL